MELDVIEQFRRIMPHVGENQNLLGLRSKDFCRQFQQFDRRVVAVRDEVAVGKQTG